MAQMILKGDYVIWGYLGGYIGIMDKKMETTISGLGFNTP